MPAATSNVRRPPSTPPCGRRSDKTQPPGSNLRQRPGSRTRASPSGRAEGSGAPRSLRQGFLVVIVLGVVAEEDLLEAGLARGAQVLQPRHPYELAGAKNAHRVADVLDLGQDVRGEEQGGPAIPGFAEQLVELLLVQRVEPVGRLIKDQEVGLVHEGEQNA